MNLRFLGDALDHWKGSVFESLHKSNLLHNFKVDAMASDEEAWQPQDLELFSNLLRIRQDQIISHKQVLNGNRDLYFDEIPNDCDLFLDPDTGFKTGKVKDLRQYVKPEEFHFLLGRSNKRVIAVYQHVRAKLTRDRVEEVLEALKYKQSRFSCVSYESGTVALLFLSLSRERIKEIRDYFHELLGVHAENRIGQWYE